MLPDFPNWSIRSWVWTDNLLVDNWLSWRLGHHPFLFLKVFDYCLSSVLEYVILLQIFISPYKENYPIRPFLLYSVCLHSHSFIWWKDSVHEKLTISSSCVDHITTSQQLKIHLNCYVIYTYINPIRLYILVKCL